MYSFGYEPQPLDGATVDRHSFASVAAVREASAADTRHIRKMWRHGVLLNQRRLPACTGFSMAAELIASPFRDEVEVELGNAYARNHYRRGIWLRYGDELYAEKVDKVGLGIIDVARVAVERRLLDGYAWARSTSEIRDAIVAVGPVIVGVAWLESMLQTDRDGRVRCDFDSGVYGSHAVVLTGYDPEAPVKGGPPAFRVRNSWGHEWGARVDRRRTGTGWLRVSDLERLLALSAAADGTWMDSVCLPLGRQSVNVRKLLKQYPETGD